MNISIRQIIIGSIPTLAAILGFLWFRRKKKDPAITWKEEVEVVEEDTEVLESKDVSPVKEEIISKLDITPKPKEPTQVVTKAEVVVHQSIPTTLEKPVSAVKEEVKPLSSQPMFDIERHILPQEEKGTKNTPVSIASLSVNALDEKPSDLCEKSPEQGSGSSSTSDQSSDIKPSEEQKESTPEVSLDKKVEVIENGIDTSSNPEEATNCSSEKVIIASEDMTCSSASYSWAEQACAGNDDIAKPIESKEEIPSMCSPKTSPSNIKSADENANLESAPLKIKVEPVEEQLQSENELLNTSSQTTSSQPEDQVLSHPVSVKTVVETPVCKKEPKSEDTHEHMNGDVVDDENDRLQNGSGENMKDKVKQEQNHSPAGDCDHANSDAQSEVSSDSGRGASGIETPTATSPSELNECTVYEFDFPTDSCGRLIGRAGKNINTIKAQTGTEIILKRKVGVRDFQTCSIEGTQSQVRAALELIKARFPTKQFRNITYEQTNLVEESPVLMPQVMQLNLPEGVSLDVIVSSVVDANHVFVQQVTHPTFPSLEKLGQCMAMCYSSEEVPELPRPIESGMICAAPMYSGWYRAMVTGTFPDTDEVEIKYIDYGGYIRVGAALLRQIRTDFMGLPFQATECFLANVIPLTDQEGFGVEASACLESLVQGVLLQAQIVGRAEDGSPYIEIYSTAGPQPVFINRELVNMGVARWYEMQA